MAHLEGQLQLRPSDDDVGEVQQVDLQGIKHTLQHTDSRQQSMHIGDHSL
jgi:hypothetical protein